MKPTNLEQLTKNKMERRMQGNLHVRCGAGEKSEAN